MSSTDSSTERGSAANGAARRTSASSVVDRPVVHGAHRDDLLGEHVERVGGHAQRLDRARPASARRRRRSARGRRGTSGRARRATTAPTWWPARPTRCRPLATDWAATRPGRRGRPRPCRCRARGCCVATTAGQPAGLEVLLDRWRAAPCSPSRGGRGPARRGAAGRARLGHDLRRGAGEPAARGRGTRRADGVGARSAASQPLLPDLVEPGGEPLGEPPGVGEHEGRAVLGDEVDDALLDVRPDRGALLARPAAGPRRGRRCGSPSAAMSATGTTTSRSHSLVDGGCTTVDRAGRRRGSGRPPRRPDGGGQPDPLRRAARAGRRAARGESARCAPRLVPATACTSSMMTVSTPASASRACEVSSRNSDSGVVMRTSVGVRAKARRSSAGVSPERTATVMSGAGSPSRVGGVPDADQRGAQVALDVDGERLHRRDVEHPAALQRAPSGGGCAGQPVERPEERRQRLARAGGRDDEGVVAAADRLPGAGLGGRGRAEAAPEPRGGGGGEAVEHVAGHVGASLYHPAGASPADSALGAQGVVRRGRLRVLAGRRAEAAGRG